MSRKRCLFVADPLPSLKVASDSSLAMLREGQRRGWQAFWTVPEALAFRNGDLLARARRVDPATEKTLPSQDTEEVVAVADFDLVFVRKDPPFNSHYLRMCWWLGLEERRTRIVNTPSVLVRFHEKLLPWEALARGFFTREQLVPTYTADAEGHSAIVRDFPGGDYVVKPFFGFAGSSVERWSGGTLYGGEPQLLQPFQPAIHTRGDRRVLYVNGRCIGDFVRRPPEGGFVANLAAGGRADLLPMTEKEAEVVQALGRFLAEVGIAFAGADLIGERLSEVNITSPTGLMALKSLTGTDGAALLWDALS